MTPPNQANTAEVIQESAPSFKIFPERDKNLTKQGMDLLTNYYLKEGETSPQEALRRAAITFSYGDYELAERIYSYVSKQWFFYASPVLSNAPKGHWINNWEGYNHTHKRFWEEDFKSERKKCWVGEDPGKAMPISCFLTYIPDTIKGQIAATNELAALSVSGGGVGQHNGIRAVSDKAPGPIPYLKTVDSSIGYYRQGKTRRGSVAVYMDVNHPDIMEFLKIRVPSGGDPERKVDNRQNFHNAINITQEFIEAVLSGDEFHLRCPHTNEIRDTVDARELWETILDVRALTGEPYLHFIDVSNKHMNEFQKKAGMKIRGSNLCSEITLVTDEHRTAVCCLSSVNLEKFDEWKDTNMVQDLIRFLDNVLQFFIDFAPEELSKAAYSAKMERSLGLGAMGFHGYLQKNSIPFESGGFNSAVQMNNIMFRNIKEQAVLSSRRLAVERGEPMDIIGSGMRNTHLLAIAPNANSAILCDTSASIEPIAANAYTSKTRAGSYLVRNKHLEEVLKKYGMNTFEVWQDIIQHDGSVQHLDQLSDHEKQVYKTAREMDMHWVVQHAEDRQPFICQAQSLNLHFPAGSDKKYINSVHLKAAVGGVIKSLYYFRTTAKASADTVKKIERKAITDWAGEECVACQG